MNLRGKIILFLLVLIAAGSLSADPFQRLKDDLARSRCTELVFISVLESSVFDDIDSIPGKAWFSIDRRYRVFIGDDVYLYDLEHLYTYSPENGQLIIESLDSGDIGPNELTALGRLDELYETLVIMPGKKYRLTLRPDSDPGNLPDAMVVTLSDDGSTLRKIEYLDINEDRNTIIIEVLKTSNKCEHSLFEPDFPDSVEVIKL